ncbi:hypothetical protein [Bradyrhizobium arachidis]|uniref:Uncharacterized protein n=1 Tax=Bradyrhizobium arachidis TaxID=858423 RepID=A0AAE7TJT9_9BRAD|nr:hypothetical protein [Bradyrhizobium arachidis]QOZ70644.1 hypothetical protein WN72_33320 [Bradyrhizobium arachidis]SFU59285.1 hypothetical protein SAMN05192541_10314 [Bradyrhizobium arachidis]
MAQQHDDAINEGGCGSQGCQSKAGTGLGCGETGGGVRAALDANIAEHLTQFWYWKKVMALLVNKMLKL